MSIVKHKRGSAPEVSARREAELKALAENQKQRLITAISLLRTMNSGQGRCEEVLSTTQNSGICTH